MNICIQIRDVIDIIKERSHLSFQDAAGAFYHSKTYLALQNTENTLWAESAGYIADRFYEELEEEDSENQTWHLAASGAGAFNNTGK